MRAWGPVVLYAALILGVSSIPAHAMPSSDTLWSLDKLVHGVEYFVLGALLARAFAVGPGLSPVYACLLAMVVGAGFGALDEWYQTTTPGRNGTQWDAVADAIGAACGALAALAWRARRTLQPEEEDARRT